MSGQEEQWLFGDKAREEAQEMLVHTQPVRTICNVVRYLNTKCTTPEQKYLCEEIIWMAKKMDAKLQFYKKDWDKGIWKRENLIIT
jgi:hypothetical protein